MAWGNATVKHKGFPRRGKYMATRKSDGFLFMEINLGGMSKIRTYKDPSEVEWLTEAPPVLLIEKAGAGGKVV